jgi:hypothetical protein
MSSPLLQDLLTNWTDPDGAMFCMGVSLGLWPDDWPTHGLGNKWIFWVDNPLGNALHQCLENLVETGVLECNPDEGYQQFRWSPKFSVENYDEAQNGEWRRQQAEKAKDADSTNTKTS